MGGRAGGGAGMGRGSRGGLAHSLGSREGEIKNSPIERNAIFDEKGNLLFKNDNGTEHSVSFKGAESKMKDSIYTHNHPNGMSLSPDDYVVAATYNLKEMRVVTKGVTYSLKRPASGWGLAGKDKQGVIGVAFSDAKKSVTARLKHYVMNYKGDKQQALGRADRIMSHMVNRLAAKKLGWDYSKSKTK